MEKEAMILKESKKGFTGGLGGRKWRGELMQLYYNLKNKRNSFK